jgi:hypothetical protein
MIDLIKTTAHSDADEEEAREQIAERKNLRDQLVGILGLADEDPGEKRSQCGGQAERPRDGCRPQAEERRPDDEQLAHSAPGDDRQGPGCETAGDHEGRHRGKRSEQEVLARRGAFRPSGQSGHQRDHGHHCEVLEQEDAGHHPSLRGGDLRAIDEQAEDHRRRGQSEQEAHEQGVRGAEVPERQQRGRADRNDDLQGTTEEEGPTELPQPRE